MLSVPNLPEHSILIMKAPVLFLCPEALSCSWRQMAKADLMLQLAGFTRLLG